MHRRLPGIAIVLMAWVVADGWARLAWAAYPGRATESRHIKADERALIVVPEGYAWSATPFRPLLYVDHLLTGSRHVFRSAMLAKRGAP